MQRSFLGRGYAGNAGRRGGRGAKGKSLSAIGVSSSLSTWGTSQHSHRPGNREDGDVPTVGRYLETWGTARRFRELALRNGWGSPGGAFPCANPSCSEGRARAIPSPTPPPLSSLLFLSPPPTFFSLGFAEMAWDVLPPVVAFLPSA